MSDYKPIDLEAFLQMVENVCKYEDRLSYQVIEEGVKRQMAMREAVIDHCDREPRFSKVQAEMHEKILNEIVVPIVRNRMETYLRSVATLEEILKEVVE